VTKELIQQARQEYLAGASLWELTVKYQGVSKVKVRSWIADIIRDRTDQMKERLSAEEVAQRAAEIREKWPPEVASKRWVGRYGTRPAESRGSCLSKVLRDMNGKDG